MRDSTAYSHLAGREVPTDSEEWRHECEVATVLALSPSQYARFFDGWTNAEGRRDRSLAEMRGPEAVERLKADVVRLDELRRAART